MSASFWGGFFGAFFVVAGPWLVVVPGLWIWDRWTDRRARRAADEAVKRLDLGAPHRDLWDL